MEIESLGFFVALKVGMNALSINKCFPLHILRLHLSWWPGRTSEKIFWFNLLFQVLLLIKGIRYCRHRLPVSHHQCLHISAWRLSDTMFFRCLCQNNVCFGALFSFSSDEHFRLVARCRNNERTTFCLSFSLSMLTLSFSPLRSTAPLWM